MQCLRILRASLRCFSSSRSLYNTAVSCRAPGPSLGSRTVDKSDHLNVCLTLNCCVRRMCSGGRSCWSCGSSAQMFFCSSCKTIQPPDNRSNYFEIFNCDQTFAVDTRKLQRRFLELQRSLHPDNFSQKSPTEQSYSEEQSALVNNAYKTLQRPLTRSLYMVMEFNEKLAQTRSRGEVDAMGQEVRVTLHNLTEQMNASLNKGDLQSAKELLGRMKYFTNLEEKVKKKLTDSL